jgi:RNA polymerase sigma-70 factor, ECF subfamily
MSDTDRLLVARAQAGDKGAFGALAKKYRHRLMRVLARFFRDPAEVEDVTQDVLLKAYCALPQFRGDSAFFTWLYVIGFNTARNHLKAMGRRPPSSIELEHGEPLRDIATPEGLMLSNEIAQTLNDAIEELPGELRTALVLRELELMEYCHIARKMSCPTGTVRSRIFRAREALAERLRPLLDTRQARR